MPHVALTAPTAMLIIHIEKIICVMAKLTSRVTFHEMHDDSTSFNYAVS